MERTYTLTAFTLRGYALAEADRILVLMTREHGLKRVVAKGLRKPKSRIGGRLEPFRENRVMLAKGKNMDVVVQAEGSRSYPDVSRDFEAMACAMSAAELLLAFLEDGDPQAEAYDLYAELLEALVPGASAETLLAGFELHLLDLLGYRPQLDACVGCDRPLAEDGHVAGLHIEGGGAMCDHCAGLHAGRLRRLGPGAWSLLSALQDAPLAASAGSEIPQRLVSHCRHALKDYLSHRAERELRAQGMFDWQGAPAGV